MKDSVAKMRVVLEQALSFHHFPSSFVFSFVWPSCFETRSESSSKLPGPAKFCLCQHQ